ncbi:hypothetical protein BX265_7666 [Streptomyces sp. TLI_235]|nr:hypothetical protein BX265_7666 [Streptomyces sp. TLI_235]
MAHQPHRWISCGFPGSPDHLPRPFDSCTHSLRFRRVVSSPPGHRRGRGGSRGRRPGPQEVRSRRPGCRLVICADQWPISACRRPTGPRPGRRPTLRHRRAPRRNRGGSGARKSFPRHVRPKGWTRPQGRAVILPVRFSNVATSRHPACPAPRSPTGGRVLRCAHCRAGRLRAPCHRRSGPSTTWPASEPTSVSPYAAAPTNPPSRTAPTRGPDHPRGRAVRGVAVHVPRHPRPRRPRPSPGGPPAEECPTTHTFAPTPL